jgi:GNAT superfamily N-acetyltransferase
VHITHTGLSFYAITHEGVTGRLDVSPSVEVINVWVRQDMRRQGVATALLRQAEDVLGRPVAHSESRTVLGDLWARAVAGGDVPELDDWSQRFAQGGAAHMRRLARLLRTRAWRHSQRGRHERALWCRLYAAEYQRIAKQLETIT